MKKLSLYIFLGLMFCNVGFTANYEELLNKVKTVNNKETIEIMDEVILGFEFENSFLEDCVNEIKYFKEWGDKCKKVALRMDGQHNLMNVFASENLQSNLLEIGKKLDNGEKLDFIDKTKLQTKMDKIIELYGKHGSLLKKINFLRDNL